MRKITVPSLPGAVVPILELALIVCLAAGATAGMFLASTANLHWVIKVLTVLLLLAWVFIIIAIIGTRVPRHLYTREPKDTHWTPDPIIAFRYTVQALGDREYKGDIPATCKLGRKHQAPSWHCTCGYYAFKTRAIAEGYDSNMWANRPHELLLCLLWGRVIETEKGYRAERMTPVAWVSDYNGFYVSGRSRHLPQLPTIPAHDVAAIEHVIDRTINNLDIEQYQPYDRRRNGHRKTRS